MYYMGTLFASVNGGVHGAVLLSKKMEGIQSSLTRRSEDTLYLLQIFFL